jgi:hypothetical protein
LEIQKPLAKQVGGDIIENKTYLYLKAVAFQTKEAEN